MLHILCRPNHVLDTAKQHFALPAQPPLPMLVRSPRPSHSFSVPAPELPQFSPRLGLLFTLLGNFKLFGKSRRFTFPFSTFEATRIPGAFTSGSSFGRRLGQQGLSLRMGFQARWAVLWLMVSLVLFTFRTFSFCIIGQPPGRCGGFLGFDFGVCLLHFGFLDQVGFDFLGYIREGTY